MSQASSFSDVRLFFLFALTSKNPRREKNYYFFFFLDAQPEAKYSRSIIILTVKSRSSLGLLYRGVGTYKKRLDRLVYIHMYIYQFRNALVPNRSTLQRKIANEKTIRVPVQTRIYIYATLRIIWLHEFVIYRRLNAEARVTTFCEMLASAKKKENVFFLYSFFFNLFFSLRRGKIMVIIILPCA